jgi:peptidoglycan/LPS O-acetylase OafA/YrhL
MAQKFENIQALRAVAALAVLAAHVKGAELDYGGAGTLLPHFPYMGVAGVDLFFVISGFVMALAAGAKRGPQAASRFFYNRAARIYPAYWAATLILLALYAGKRVLFAEDTPWPNKIATFLLTPSDQYPLLPVGWTLVHEIYFYAVFAMFLLTRAPLLVFLAAWGAVILAAHAAGIDAINAWTKVATSPLTFEFIAGAAIARLPLARLSAFALPALAAGAGGFAVLSAFSETLYPDAFADFWRRTLTFGPLAALIVFGAAALEGKRQAPRVLVATGDASYSIYLIHVPVFLVVGKLTTLVLSDGVFDNALLVIGYSVVALAAAFALHRLIEKPLLARSRKWGDRLFG